MSEIIISTEFLTELDLSPKKESRVVAVILKPKRTENFFNADIMGTTSLELVRTAAKNYTTFEKSIEANTSIVEEVKEFAKDCDYIVALYADTPLVTDLVLQDAVEYATTKGLDFCKLPRGAILKVSALSNGFEWTGEATFLAPKNFFCVFDYKTLATARQEIKHRIIDKWLGRGVNILDVENVYIEQNVDIAEDVTICSGNILKGNTSIKKGCLLGENNIIENSEIGEKSKITNCFISSKKIKSGANMLGEKQVGDKK